MIRRILVFSFLLIVAVSASYGDTISLRAKETLTGVEMSHGDVLRFELKNEEVRTLEVLDSDIRPLLSNLSDLHKGRPGGGTVYQFTWEMRIDGQPITLSTPFRPADTIDGEIGFFVRIRHKNGVDKVWMEPEENRIIGTFEFDGGKDGFVEILAEGWEGLVVADAVEFKGVGY